MIISKDTKMAEVVHFNFQLIPIISRFNIEFGFGDKTVKEVCRDHGVNPHLFIEIVNFFNNEDYNPSDKIKEVPLKDTVNYLLRSHHFFNREKLPYIEELIGELCWENKEHGKNKGILNRFFDQYRKEAEVHTSQEEKEVYPFVLEIEKAYKERVLSENMIKKLSVNSVKKYQETHDQLNTALLDLKNIIIKYLPPADNTQITEKILTEIFRLEKDMADHTLIEDTVLLPVAYAMEKEIRKLIK